jgi:hypothetical protein
MSRRAGSPETGVRNASQHRSLLGRWRNGLEFLVFRAPLTPLYSLVGERTTNYFFSMEPE